MRRIVTPALIVIACAGPTQAAERPEPGQGDPRVRYVNYHENQVTLVHVRRGQVTRIVLEDGEQIAVAATGLVADCQNAEALWCIRADVGTNVIWVKPKVGAVSNNLELNTDRRDYSVEFKVDNSTPAHQKAGAVARGAARVTDTTTFRVIFRYPVKLPSFANFMAATVARPQLDEKAVLDARLAAAAPDRRNLKYSMEIGKSAKSIAPVEAFDDGRFTYFRFLPGRDLPTMYVIDDDGAEARVNYHIDGEYAVIQRLGPRFVLRLGRMAVGIWNDAYLSSPAPSPDGTTVAGVERALKGELDD